MGLRLDTDRPFRKRDAGNLGPRIEAERLERFVYPVCDERVGVRIDDEIRRRRVLKGALQLPVLRDVYYHCDAQKALARGIGDGEGVRLRGERRTHCHGDR